MIPISTEDHERPTNSDDYVSHLTEVPLKPSDELGG